MLKAILIGATISSCVMIGSWNTAIGIGGLAISNPWLIPIVYIATRVI